MTTGGKMDRSWTDRDVHEGLLRWGVLAARLDDGGLGYKNSSMGLDSMRQRPHRALDPGELMTHELHSIDAAVRELKAALKVVVLCYYKPGHLRACWPGIGTDGKGRQRSPSTRAIGAYLLVSRDVIEGRLRKARQEIAQRLTVSPEASRIAVMQ